MPTTVTNTIGTGGGYDYSTISAWEAGTQGDLVAADEIRRGVIQDASYYETLSAAFVVAGSTTDATRYRELTAAAGASFSDNIVPATGPVKFDTANGCTIKSANTAYTTHFDFQEAYFRTSRIQWELMASRGWGVYANTLIADSICYSASSVSIDFIIGQLLNCLVIQNIDTRFAQMNSNGSAINCTFVCPSDATYTSDPFTRPAYTSGQFFINCAFFGSAIGALNSNFTYINCATNRSSPPTGVTNVAYDTTTGSGFEGTTVAAQDWRIKSTSALKDAGTSSGAPTEDILGQTRGASFDIGVFELFVSSSPVLSAATAFDITTTTATPRVTITI